MRRAQHVCDLSTLQLCVQRGSFKLQLQQLTKLSCVQRHRHMATVPLSNDIVSNQPHRVVIRGLHNLGNTCFFNSTVQCLCGLRDVAAHFLAPQTARLHLGSVTSAMRGLIEASYETGKAFSPSELHAATVKSARRFAGRAQHDAHELLRVLLDLVDTEEELRQRTARIPVADGTPRPRPLTIIGHAFGGRMLSIVTCGTCGVSSTVTEPFLDLSLEIPGSRRPFAAAATAAAGSLSARASAAGATAAERRALILRGQKGKVAAASGSKALPDSIAVANRASGNATPSVATARKKTSAAGLAAAKAAAAAEIELRRLERELGLKASAEKATVSAKTRGAATAASAEAISVATAGGPSTGAIAAECAAIAPDSTTDRALAAMLETGAAGTTHDQPTIMLQQPARRSKSNTGHADCTSTSTSGVAESDACETHERQTLDLDTVGSPSTASLCTATSTLSVETPVPVSLPDSESFITASEAPSTPVGQSSLDSITTQASNSCLASPSEAPSSQAIPITDPTTTCVAIRSSNAVRLRYALVPVIEAADESTVRATQVASVASVATACSSALKLDDGNTLVSATTDSLKVDRNGATTDSTVDGGGTAAPALRFLATPLRRPRYWVPPVVEATDVAAAVAKLPRCASAISTLEGCFTAFTALEGLVGANGYRCAVCGAAEVAVAARASEERRRLEKLQALTEDQHAVDIDDAGGRIHCKNDSASLVVIAVSDEDAGRAAVVTSLSSSSAATEVASNAVIDATPLVSSAGEDAKAKATEAVTSCAPASRVSELAVGADDTGEEFTSIVIPASSTAKRKIGGKGSRAKERHRAAAAAQALAATSKAVASAAVDQPRDTDSDDSGPRAVVSRATGGSSTTPAPPKATPVIYPLRDATKRLLLAPPPPRVLTLHLKRFAAISGGRHGVMSKISGFVAFPEVLDVTPYMAQEVLPQVEGAAASDSQGHAAAPSAAVTGPCDLPPQSGNSDTAPPMGSAAAAPFRLQQQLESQFGVAVAPPVPQQCLYRLAGAVVHSGSMGGGHYIAYVRYGEPELFVDAEGGQLLDPPCGQSWAYVSDSSVSVASLDNVLSCEAYILFYERVKCVAQ